MKCYSPFPQSDYTWHGETITYRPVKLDDPHTWNLVWLSIPGVDQLLGKDFNIGKAESTVNPTAVGSLSALKTTLYNPSLAEIMGNSPIQFVQAFQDSFDLSKMRVWDLLNGQEWVETMTRRAYEADGLGDVYEKAAASANVVLADFKLKTRLK